LDLVPTTMPPPDECKGIDLRLHQGMIFINERISLCLCPPLISAFAQLITVSIKFFFNSTCLLPLVLTTPLASQVVRPLAAHLVLCTSTLQLYLYCDEHPHAYSALGNHVPSQIIYHIGPRTVRSSSYQPPPGTSSTAFLITCAAADSYQNQWVPGDQIIRI
jgi:hypothetical protein